MDNVMVIQSSGLPIYSYDPDNSINQAGFFTAMANFATEIDKGAIEMITFEKSKFYIRRKGHVLFVFADDPQSDEIETSFAEKLESVIENFMFNMDKEGLTGMEYDFGMYGTVIDFFIQDLRELDIIAMDAVDVEESRTRIQNLLFKSVGYEPGVCNIGRKQRFYRFLQGVGFILLSFLGLYLINYFELDPLFKLLLIIPNVIGSMGFFQTFFRFCVNNALQNKYQLD